MYEDLFEKVARVFRLDAGVYSEVATDLRATGPALVVVFAAALLEALGQAGHAGIEGLLEGFAMSCLRWGIWICAIHAGAVVLGLRSNLSALFRALGFAAAPFALGLGEMLPLLAGVFWIAKWVLVGWAFVAASRRVLGVETPTALGLCGVTLAGTAALLQLIA